MLIFKIINTCLDVNLLKWSSQGGTVRLVDLQEQQLQDGLKYVEQLRADATDHEGEWGKIETSQPSSLKSTLQDAWLVVEVWLNS